MAAASGKGVSEAERRRKIRESLMNWYEVKEDHAQADAQAAAIRPEPSVNASDPERDALNIESSNFSAVKFTTEMLQKKSLPDIVKMDNILRRQVKDLDTELKELVYDNYSKFISATDTIRQVRTNVADMDSRLEALSNSVAAMDRVSQTVTTELAVHRERIESVLSMNTVLRKLQFLVKLPNVLARAIATGRLVDGVKYWVAGDAVLVKYNHIPAFNETHQNSRLVAEELYATLCADVLSRCIDGVPSPNVAKAEARPSAETTGVAGTVKPTADEAAAATAVDAKKLAVGLQKAIESLRLLSTTSIDIARAAATHATAFPVTKGATINDAIYAVVSAKALAGFTQSFQNAESSFRDEALKRATVDCAAVCKSDNFTADLVVCLERSLAKEALDRIHHNLLSLHAVLTRTINAVGAENVTTVECSVTTTIMSSAQPLLSSLLETYREVVSATFINIAMAVSGAIARRCSGAEIISAENCRTALLAVANMLATSAVDFSTGVRNIAKDNLRSEHFDHVKSFEGLIDATLVDGLRHLYDRLRALCDPASLANETVTHGGATASSFAFALSFSGVAKLVGAVVLQRLKDQNALLATDEAVIKEYRDKFDDCGRRFANTAIMIRASDIRDRCIDLTGGSSVDLQGPSPSAFAVAKEWQHAYHVCQAVLIQNIPGTIAKVPSKSGSNVVPAHRRTNSNQGSASAISGDARVSSSASSRKFSKVPNHIRKDNFYTSDVDRLFAKPTGQALFLRPSSVDPTHVVECIIVATLVFWVDAVRERTSFANQEFQKMQIDGTFILAVVGVHRDWYRRDERWVPLVDEMVTSVFERTAERIAMPTDQLLNIINNTADTLQD